uniref:Thiopurine S-methyltransferase-like n=1 Tax=Oryzias latipes TaxID=8090 RepID=A0A286P9V2_ORYLA|nr:thiopurine S-methyltransferase-like [Oryzias latipes]
MGTAGSSGSAWWTKLASPKDDGALRKRLGFSSPEADPASLRWWSDLARGGASEQQRDLGHQSVEDGVDLGSKQKLQPQISSNLSARKSTSKTMSTDDFWRLKVAKVQGGQTLHRSYDRKQRKKEKSQPELEKLL